jgi:peptidoglycan/xylan/chitin deacetylase (PgdA/CDA1 family)
MRTGRLTFTVLIVLTVSWLAFSAAPAQAEPPKPFTVYLGFDDGPVVGRTDKILDVLLKYNVKATFFIEGKHVAGAGELLRREILEGHHLGSHLWMHEALAMARNRPSKEFLLQRYQITDEAIRAALGEDLWKQYNEQEPIKPFRWPGGAAEAFPRPDVITYNWDVSAGDDVAGAIRTARIVNNVLYGYPPAHYYGVYAWGDGTVVLLHDTSLIDATTLPIIIENLRKHGAVFATLPRPGDQPGTMPIKIGAAPPCANKPGDCTRENSLGVQ